MKAFITGITGFIGSHVAELLLRDGDEVMGATQGEWLSDAPRQLVDSVELLHWDVQSSAPEHLMQRVNDFCPDAVFHFAAISIPALCGSKEPTQQASSVNVGGTIHLLDLVQHLSAKPRVIFTSTSHVYDQVTRSGPFVTEAESQLRPTTPYGQTKLKCEEEIQSRIQKTGLDACIVRGFHHIGPRQPSGLMLTDWLEQLQDPNRHELHVRCTNSYLDLVDVRDAAIAYRDLVHRGSTGEVYNLGSGRISRSGDVLQVILSKLGRDVNVIERSADEQWNPIADIRKLSSLGWNPQTEYTETIGDMMFGKRES